MKTGRYRRINKNLDEFEFKINTFVPKPSDKDYKKGYITRYFLIRANDINSFIYEISKDSYKKFISSSLVTTISLDWKLTGDINEIKKSNSESIRLASKKIPKISLYLPNLLQYSKI